MLKFLFISISLLSLNTFASSILFLGDSLTEGYGISKEKAYPTLVKELFKTKSKKDISIINGGVSGSTSADALARLKWYKARKPKYLFLALGANDGLRGLKISQTQKNLQEIIDFAKSNGMIVFLAGMMMPPNYGKKYTEDFKNMYLKLKSHNKLKMMPFLLQDVAGITKLNQADGIHPNIYGHEIMAKNVYDFLKGAL